MIFAAVESFDDVTSIAVPILDPARRVAGAVSILGTSADMLPDLQRLSRMVQLAGRPISRAMPR